VIRRSRMRTAPRTYCAARGLLIVMSMHAHRRNAIPPLALALVLLAATAAAVLPLAVVLGAFQWRHDASIAIVIGAVVVFALLFPFGFRYASREDKP